jgi:RloB-like protein
MRQGSGYPATSLKRGKAKRPPRIRLTIFCEGGRTEIEYLRQVKLEAQNLLVDLEGPCGVPESVVGQAIAHKKRSRRRRRDSFEEADQVWVVFDCDEHSVSAAISRAKAAGIGVAYSNPCFELWGLLHFDDHDAPLHHHALQKLLKIKTPTYDRYTNKCFDYGQMKHGYVEADKRAEKMEQRRILERRPMGNPFTSVYKLVRLIFDNGKNS